MSEVGFSSPPGGVVSEHGSVVHPSVFALVVVLTSVLLFAGPVSAGTGVQASAGGGLAFADTPVQSLTGGQQRQASTGIGSCTVIDQSGHYVLTQDIENATADQCIEITNDDVVFDGQNHTIDGVGAVRTDGILVLRPGGTRISNVTVRNVSVTDWDTGIFLGAADESLVTSVRVSDLNNDRSGTGVWLRETTNSTVSDSVFENTSRSIYLLDQGAGSTPSANNVVRNNTMRETLTAGIAVAGANDTTIEGNTIHTLGIDSIVAGTFSAGTDFRALPVSNVTATDNVVNHTEKGIGFELRGANFTIINNTVRAPETPEMDLLVKDSTVSNNTLTNGEISVCTGVFLLCRDNVIMDNQLGRGEIILEDSVNQTLRENEFAAGGGVFLQGSQERFWATHTITTSNTVHGDPIRYVKNWPGGTVAPTGGQIILADTENVTITDQRLSRTVAGIQVGFSNGTTITDTEVTNTGFAVDLFVSNRTVIRNYTVRNSGIGLFVSEDSTDNRLTESRMSEMFSHGVVIEGDRNSVTDTTIDRAGQFGVQLGAPRFATPDGTRLENVTITETLIGVLSERSRDTTLRNVEVRDIRNLALAFELSDNVTGENVSLGPKISFTGRNFAMNDVETPPADPATRRNVGQYLNVRYTTDDRPSLNLTIHYADSDAVGIDESTLGLWGWDGDNWSEMPGSSVDTDTNEVTGRITDFNFSVFAPLGRLNTPTPTPDTPTPTPTPTPDTPTPTPDTPTPTPTPDAPTPEPETVYWQVDFAEGSSPPDPPSYWPADLIAALGNSDDGVTQNPSVLRQRKEGQLKNVTIVEKSLQFDDENNPISVTVEFEIEEGTQTRDLHLASFVLPGPFDEDEIDQQELHDLDNGTFDGGETGELTVSIPQESNTSSSASETTVIKLLGVSVGAAAVLSRRRQAD